MAPLGGNTTIQWYSATTAYGQSVGTTTLQDPLKAALTLLA